MANPGGPETRPGVTGTLLGVAHPTAIAQVSNSVFNFPGPVPWIPNDPQIAILGVGTNNNLPQTTFSYKDIYTQDIGGGSLKTITQNGILVQDAAGLFFAETATAAAIPVVETCAFEAGSRAICRFGNDEGPLDFTVTAIVFPFFTYTLQLPATSSGGPSSTSHSSSESRTSESRTSDGLTTNTQREASLPHKVPVGPIVGGVLGGFVIVIAILVFLLWRRKRRLQLREKVEFDPDPYSYANPNIQLGAFTRASQQGVRANTLPSATSKHTATPASSQQQLMASHLNQSAWTMNAPQDSSGVGTNSSLAAIVGTAAGGVPPTKRERRQRLEQMQDTVQTLQRNLSVRSGPDSGESELAVQRQQIALLMEEVGRLREIVAQDPGAPRIRRVMSP